MTKSTKMKSKGLNLAGYCSIVAVLALTFQMCKSGGTTVSTTQSNQNEPQVSYLKDILPIMQAKCTPCHFPERGFKKMLNTYDAAKENINEMLMRVQLNPQDERFMPFKSKRPQLTASEIQLFKDWKKLGMPN